jgi:cytoskeletal protein RodZ
MELNMSDTDIYKNREALPPSPVKHKRRRRRSTSESAQPFDQKVRKRRSKNSGFRRILHLSRKSENEKFIWWGLLISIVAVLLIVFVWQFIIQTAIYREQAKEDDYITVHESIPESDDQRLYSRQEPVKAAEDDSASE